MHLVTNLPFHLVACEEKYWNFVRKLRNDSRVSQFFIESVLITPEMQIQYMRENSDFYRICLFNGQPVGYVGVLNDDLRICTHPDFQGMGVGTFMLGEILKLFPQATAKVKAGNKPSLKLLQKAGFQVKYYLLER
jgi:RimJ/RimL family protein N-acetyltransferase